MPSALIVRPQRSMSSLSDMRGPPLKNGRTGKDNSICLLASSFVKNVAVCLNGARRQLPSCLWMVTIAKFCRNKRMGCFQLSTSLYCPGSCQSCHRGPQKPKRHYQHCHDDHQRGGDRYDALGGEMKSPEADLQSIAHGVALH